MSVAEESVPAAEVTTGRRTAVRNSIFALMGIARWSQTALAARVGLSQPQLSQRLNGHVPFDEDELALIAEVFRITPADLYNTQEAIALAVRNGLCFTTVIHSGQMELTFSDPPSLSVAS